MDSQEIVNDFISRQLLKRIVRLVWKPFPYLNCIPCLGHVGITNSEGHVFDFRHDEVVGVDIFGEQAQEYLLETKDAILFDESLGFVKNVYMNPGLALSEYAFLSNNCHHFVAYVLNVSQQTNRYSAWWVYKTLAFSGRRINKYSGCCGCIKLHWQPIMLWLLIMILSTKPFYAFGTVRTITGNAARFQLLKGVSQMKRAAVATLGPHGRNVVIQQENGLPRITKDGVTVVRSVFLEDRLQDVAASLIRQSSGQTNKLAGDGTTTSVVIASSIFELGQKYIQAGYNPIFLIRGIKLAKEQIINYLESIKTEVDDDQILYSVVKVSSNYDDNIAQCVFEAIKAVGLNGVASIEPGGTDIQLKISQGASINRGLMHQQFADPGKTNLVLNYPFVLTSKVPLQTIKQILPILELVKNSNQPLFVIAQDISQEVMSSLLFNHTKGIIRIGAITIPGFGSHSDEIITDFSELIGSTLVTDENVEMLKQFTLNDLGQVIKVDITPQDTQIIGTHGVNSDNRKQMIENEMKDCTSSNRLSLLQDRLQRFVGQSAVIYVGGNSEVETHENRDKIVDSLNAAKNTLKYGVLPGGGAALVHASKLLNYFTIDGEAQMGVKLLQQTIQQPLRQLCINAGINGEQLLSILLEQDDYNIGYDLKKQSLGNMIDMGVVDSLQVVRQALEDGISLGSMLLSTEIAIVQNLRYTPTPLNQYKKEIF